MTLIIKRFQVLGRDVTVYSDQHISFKYVFTVSSQLASGNRKKILKILNQKFAYIRHKSKANEVFIQLTAANAELLVHLATDLITLSQYYLDVSCLILIRFILDIRAFHYFLDLVSYNIKSCQEIETSVYCFSLRCSQTMDAYSKNKYICHSIKYYTKYNTFT